MREAPSNSLDHQPNTKRGGWRSNLEANQWHRELHFFGASLPAPRPTRSLQALMGETSGAFLPKARRKAECDEVGAAYCHSVGRDNIGDFAIRGGRSVMLDITTPKALKPIGIGSQGADPVLALGTRRYPTSRQARRLVPEDISTFTVISAARFPISYLLVSTVERDGQTQAAKSRSWNPSTDTALGTDTPRPLKACNAPSATSSSIQKNALGIAPRANDSSTRLTPKSTEFGNASLTV